MLKVLNVFKVIVPCNDVASAGGAGVTELAVPLDNPLGGIIVIDFDAKSVTDKLEIIHNGVKKATSSMTSPNEGPFDDLYGNPTIPSKAQADVTHQFVGSYKGTVPSRRATFITETGITDLTFTKQQVIWWVYTTADYDNNQSAVIRVTGFVGTAWSFKRLCTSQVPKQKVIAPPTPPAPSLSCNETANSGGVGVFEYELPLDSIGGVFIFNLLAHGVQDKFELIHNGVKKSTSGMTGTNAGPFDNLYGSPTVPSQSQVDKVPQFIGYFAGTVPRRETEFFDETGITGITLPTSYQQLLWWVYTPSDYNTKNTVTLRITGATGTAWNISRVCTTQVPKQLL